MLGFVGTERKGADKIIHTYFDFLTIFSVMYRKYSFKAPVIRLIDCYSLAQLLVSNIVSLRSWELTFQNDHFWSRQQQRSPILWNFSGELLSCWETQRNGARAAKWSGFYVTLNVTLLFFIIKQIKQRTTSYRFKSSPLLEPGGRRFFWAPAEPPIALYYMQGLNTTANHRHAALLGVYGMLGIGLMLYCMRGLTDITRWNQKLLRVSFWSLNIGLAMMTFLSLLPQGLWQTYASVEYYYAYARSAAFEFLAFTGSRDVAVKHE